MKPERRRCGIVSGEPVLSLASVHIALGWGRKTDAVDLHVAQFPVTEQVVKRRSGAILLGTGALILCDDRSECLVAAFDRNGKILCSPPSE